MLALLLVTLLLIAACFLLGQAILFVCGWTEWRWWAPAAGYGALIILFGQAVHVPNHQRALTALAVLGTLVSLAFPFVRRAARAAAGDAVLLGVLLTLLAAIPFFTAGYAGILGAGVSDDMAQHLTAVAWLRDHVGMLPVAAIGGDLITTGYPLGPHALAAALSHEAGLGDVRGFDAVTLAVPALTAFIAFGLVPRAPRPARWAFAAVIGLGYLVAAYLGQGLFKETILAMFVLGTAAMLQDLGAREGRLRWRDAVPLAAFIGGAVYTYSYGGVLWLAGVIGFFVAAEVIRRRELFSVVRDWWPAAVGALAVTALVILPELDRIKAFRNSIFGQESLRNTGNLSHTLNPLETLGVWFNGDFRFNPVPRWPTALFCVVALVALVAGLVWWWRRRALALPAAMLAALVVWIQLTLTVNIYNQAKGLVVLAPLVMACLGAPLVAAWSARAATPRGRTLLRVARGAGVMLLAGAVISSGGVLRSVPVGLGSHDAEFAQIRPIVRDKAVLFLDNDHFAEWELRGADPLYTTNALYAPLHLGMRREKNGGLPIDVDNYGRGELNKLDYILVAGAHYGSEIPPNFRLRLRTASYTLYRRHGDTPVRVPIEPVGQPGAILDCATPRGKEDLKRFKWAGVIPQPIIHSDWKGSIAKPGGTARMTVTLPRGRWDLSLQYLSTTHVTVSAPGLKKVLAQNFGLITTYWPAGSVTSDGRPITLTVTGSERTWFASLLGTPRATRAPLSPGYRPLLGAAFTRHVSVRRIPVQQACGRYVDWLAPAGSKMRGR